jgi:23S rRNA pseudouridine2605 synthase
MTEKRNNRSASKKSGWVKPDGKPMRKRRGKYFPDDEIDKSKRKHRRITDEPSSDDRRSGPRTRTNRTDENRGSSRSNPNRSDSNRTNTESRSGRPATRPSYSNKSSTYESDTPELSEDVRLNKYIANSGTCSRREADELITAGVISINGEVVTELGTKVKPGDQVRYNGELMSTEKLVYVLLNKPKDFITTVDDPQERKTVMNLVSKACKERIYPVGRLDRNTTGLLLLTNDGDLTKKLTHPSYNIRKLYSVELDKNLTKEDMSRLSDGIELDDGVVKVDQIAWENPDKKSRVGVELHSGKNRIIRRLFEAMDYNVKKLDRVVFAGLTKRDLPRGRWRLLTEMEVNMLKMLTGNKKQTKRS